MAVIDRSLTGVSNLEPIKNIKLKDQLNFCKNEDAKRDDFEIDFVLQFYFTMIS